MIVRADRARRPLVCEACGYGICVLVVPAACPMCRGETWIEPASGRRYESGAPDRDS